MPGETRSSPRRVRIGGEVARLLILAGPEPSSSGRSFVLNAEQSPVRVGRASPEHGTRLTLEDPEVSREHAQLLHDPASGAWRLLDSGSHNGCFVDAVRKAEHELDDGDVLRLGGHVLLFQRLSPADCELLIGARRKALARLVGGGRRMLRLFEEVGTAAAAKLPVLLHGETGVGKELVADALHAAWGGGPFIPVNCAALPEHLAESELFGHARGAFTGAAAAKPGLFDAAASGTLFLDEIGELSLALQAKLLRALATGEVRSVGEQRARSVDARVVAATNRDLDQAVSEGRFRGDLLARLSGARLSIPALRERREDIAALVEYFLGDAGIEIEVDALEALVVHDWPWNVRELEQVVLNAKARAESERVLRLEHLPPALTARLDDRGVALGVSPDLDGLLAVARSGPPGKEELRRVLDHFHGNVSRVAAFFGCQRRQIYLWAEQHSIDLAEARTRRNGSGSVDA
jgi:transcriptional regulator with GAF, ATPase, and Fis domain